MDSDLSFACLLTQQQAPSLAHFQSFFKTNHGAGNSYEEDRSLRSWLAWCSADMNRKPSIRVIEGSTQRWKMSRMWQHKDWMCKKPEGFRFGGGGRGRGVFLFVACHVTQRNSACDSKLCVVSRHCATTMAMRCLCWLPLQLSQFPFDNILQEKHCWLDYQF